jgi:hypothetical protein
MTALPAGLRAAAVATGVALAVLLLCWAAAAGPASLVADRDGGLRRPPAELTESPSESDSWAPGERPPRTRSGVDLSWLGTLLIWAAGIAVVTLVGLALRAAWRVRWRRPSRPEELDFETLEDTALVRQALRRDAPRLAASLDQGAPADGIVGCWLSLERSVADAGVPRARWETSGEYAVRVLHALDLDPRAVGGLAALYREARFSDHPLGEDARAAARRHLNRIAAELGEVPA